MEKWISIEGTYGSGKTSLLKFIEMKRSGIHTALPDSINDFSAPHSCSIQKQLYEMKKYIFFYESLPLLRLCKLPVDHSGLVFTDGAASCLHSRNLEVKYGIQPLSLIKGDLPDIVVFLRLPSLEDNMIRCLNKRYCIDTLKRRRDYLDRLYDLFYERSIIVDVKMDDLPEVVYSKVMSAIAPYLEKEEEEEEKEGEGEGEKEQKLKTLSNLCDRSLEYQLLSKFPHY